MYELEIREKRVATSSQKRRKNLDSEVDPIINNSKLPVLPHLQSAMGGGLDLRLVACL
jgi:hypothetical protein